MWDSSMTTPAVTNPQDATAPATAPLPSSVTDWAASRPQTTSTFDRDKQLFGRFWQAGIALLRSLPPKARRDAVQSASAAVIIDAARQARVMFLIAHSGAVYDSLTEKRTHFLRVDELSAAAAELVPGLVPNRSQLAEEQALYLRDKDGHEIDQGLLLNHVLADPQSGMHLCHAMLLPRRESLDHLSAFRRDGHIDLGGARVKRAGRTAIVTMSNPRFLNAEDDTTLAAIECAIDVCLLDPDSEICVIRGDRVEHPKYSGRRVFGSGINLTRLYQGNIPFLWYILRDMGFVNKIYRGVASPQITPDEVVGETIEKLWIAQVDGFAIGGACQLLLACDYIIAASDAYLTLPARKEGIIPGMANMRLWRFTGDRLARQAIQMERRFDCDSAEGRRICDEVVPPTQTDQAVEALVDRLLHSGSVSAVANRRAFRIAQEPLDLFRRYTAYYAKAEALCHFSPQLISNLEHYWNAKDRTT
jgi:thioesterase DpgC